MTKTSPMLLVQYLIHENLQILPGVFEGPETHRGHFWPDSSEYCGFNQAGTIQKLYLQLQSLECFYKPVIDQVTMSVNAEDRVVVIVTPLLTTQDAKAITEVQAGYFKIAAEKLK